MTIVKRNNLMFPSLMDEFFKPDWFGGMERFENTLPAVNIKENETDFELELAIPGQKKEDFNVEIDDSVMTISMEDRSEEETIKEQYTRKEFSYRSFTRSFTLPETVDEDKIEATYLDGILKFRLPKREEALPKPKRTIAIGK
ncbi:MAG: Hsp20/alpha crystallin family protein [Flavobacteriaceae bacterium]